MLIETRTVKDVPETVEASLNGFHSLQKLFDYEICIKHIFYKPFLINHLTKVIPINMLNIGLKCHLDIIIESFVSANRSFMHVHTRAGVNFGNAIM